MSEPVVKVKLTSLARAPSPAEMRAISIAVEEALRATAPATAGPDPDIGPGIERWRFSGRWWQAGNGRRAWASFGFP